ncbi:hypothetical protein D5086_011435 [Populus alba]|uniref:Uncharacterized protein n=1 Tax=Populus alba TaxID=43335 RepID=A0ACC4CDD2_POPAL
MRGGKLKETEKNGFASSCREGSGQVECGDRCNFFRQHHKSIFCERRCKHRKDTRYGILELQVFLGYGILKSNPPRRLITTWYFMTRIGGCIPPIVSLAYQNVASVAKQSAEEENHWLRSGANCSELFSMPYF